MTVDSSLYKIILCSKSGKKYARSTRKHKIKMSNWRIENIAVFVVEGSHPITNSWNYSAHRDRAAVAACEYGEKERDTDLPTRGTAIDVDGTISATMSWNTLRDSKIVIPGHARTRAARSLDHIRWQLLPHITQHYARKHLFISGMGVFLPYIPSFSFLTFSPP